MISFKLPWLQHDDETENLTFKENKYRSIEKATDKRQQKINRRNQFDQMEKALEQLKIAKLQNNNDDSLQVLFSGCF